MNELNQLHTSLAQIFREALPAPQNWGSHNAVRGLQNITKELDDISPALSSASIAQIVAAYRRSREQASFRDLKYVCYGAAMRAPDGWCVLGDDSLCGKLLAEVELLAEPRRRFKCFQALLSSYFGFARYDEQTSKASHDGWEKLRDWLANQQVQFQRLGAHWKLRLPGWFGVLNKHENLLTIQPCDRYGEEMMRGNNTNFEEARHGLSMPGDSWVMQEVILSQMKAAAALGEDSFKARLEPLLKLVQGQTEVRVSELLKRRATAILVSRYASCADKPEQPTLRDAAVAIIGNPWLKTTQWDAWVKKADGQPDDEAREMVNGWLKRRLITDFFAVLSEDGRADQRRLNYWLRFEPAIEDLWLALGPDAMRNRSQPFQELRDRARGRLLRLDNPGPPNNNAFIMKIGEWLIVEFGMKGNACYIYPEKPMPFQLGGAVISLHDLKDRNLGEQLRHADGHISWERKFDVSICQKIGYRPGNDRQGKDVPKLRPQTELQGKGNVASTTSLRLPAFDEKRFWSFVQQYSLPTEDKRSRGGALWVNIEQSHYPVVDQWLESQGFKYRSGVGWHRE